jgi:predicted nucleic acid-binding protein
MTRLELVRGMREHERQRTLGLMNSFPTHPLNASTAVLAGELIQDWHRRGVTLDGPDAAIAATAIELGAILVTLNARHFPMRELRLLIADEEGQLSWPPGNGNA